MRAAFLHAAQEILPRSIMLGVGILADDETKISAAAFYLLQAGITAGKQDELDMAGQFGGLIRLQTPVRLKGNALGMLPARPFPVFQIVLAGREENLLRLCGISAFEMNRPGISVSLHALDANAALNLGPCL